MAANAHCFTTSVRLHHTSKTGHLPFALTGPYRVRLCYGSRVRFPELRQRDYSRPRLVGYLSNEQLQGKLLSAYKISQAYPGARGRRYLLTLEEQEREHIIRALRETQGVIGGPHGAAARLGLKRTTLNSKMEKLGISRKDL